MTGGLPEAYALSLAVMMLLVCLACIRIVKAEEEAAGGVGRRRVSDTKLETLAIAADLDERRNGKSAASPTSPLCAAVCDDVEEPTLRNGSSTGGDGGGGGAKAGVHAGAHAGGRASVNGHCDDSGERERRDSSPGFVPPSSADENSKGLEGIARRAWEYLGSPIGANTPRRGKYSPVTVSALTDSANTPDELSPSDEGFARHERRR